MIPDRCSDPSRLFVGIDVSWWTRTADAIVRKPTADPTIACPRMRPILCGWLARLVGGARPAYVAAFVDSKVKTWRDLETRHLPPEERYKAGRTLCPPEYWTEVDGFLEILRLHGIPCYRADGWEADDVAATVTRQALAAGLDVALVTLDHDWRALCRDRDATGGEVYCWSYGRSDAKTIGPAEMMKDENLGVAPYLVADFIALTGDGDNIAGVRGLGPVKSRQALARWGSATGILEAAECDLDALEKSAQEAVKQRDKMKRVVARNSIADAEPALARACEAQALAASAWSAEKIRRAIVAQRDAVELGLTLATLDPYAPLVPSFSVDACRVGRFDVPALSALYRSLEFNVLADDVESATVAA